MSDIDCQKRSEESIIPVLPFRNDSDRIGLCSKRSDMSACCHQANGLALPVKISVPILH